MQPDPTHINQALGRERNFQDHKYGTRLLPISEWLLILYGELDEARQTFLNRTPKEAMREILHVAAVAIACMEQHGVYERPNVADVYYFLRRMDDGAPASPRLSAPGLLTWLEQNRLTESADYVVCKTVANWEKPQGTIEEWIAECAKGAVPYA